MTIPSSNHSNHTTSIVRAKLQRLRALAIASQCIGFFLIFCIDTWNWSNAQAYKAYTLTFMLLAALFVAVCQRWIQKKHSKEAQRQLNNKIS